MKPLFAAFVLSLPLIAADPRDAEVERTMSRFIAAFQDLDWPAFRGCWVERPVVFGPNFGPRGDGKREEGTQAFELFWKDQFQRSRESALKRGVTEPPFLTLAPKDVLIDYPAPTVAVVTFHLSGSSTSLGRRMFVLKWESSGWRITHLHASNLPLPEKK